MSFASVPIEFVITRTFEPGAEEHMDTEVLYDDTHVVVAGTKNRWLHRRRIQFADLVDEPWILPPLDSFYGSLIEDAFRSTRFSMPRTAVFTFSWLSAREPGGRQRILTTVPGFMMRSQAKHPWLKALPVELPATQKPISIVTLKNRTLSPVAELFISLCARGGKAAGQRPYAERPSNRMLWNPQFAVHVRSAPGQKRAFCSAIVMYVGQFPTSRIPNNHSLRA